MSASSTGESWRRRSDGTSVQAEYRYYQCETRTNQSMCDYHTRRAGIIWKRFSAQNPNIRLWIIGVDDPEFQRPWWRNRKSAKIFFLEFTKLIWKGFAD